jgi:hypothetical protein
MQAGMHAYRYQLPANPSPGTDPGVSANGWGGTAQKSTLKHCVLRFYVF